MSMLKIKSPMLKELSWILKPQVAIWAQFSNGPIHSTQTNNYLVIKWSNGVLILDEIHLHSPRPQNMQALLAI